MRPAGSILRLRLLESPCWRCSQPSSLPVQLSRSFTTSIPRHAGVTNSVSPRPRPGLFFFSSNFTPRAIKDGGARRPATSTTTDEASGRHTATTRTRSEANDVLPHRRRQAAKRNAAASHPNENEPSEATDDVLPVNASSALTSAAAKQPANSFRSQLSLYLSLSKPRLTMLVVLTAMTPYALYPVPAFLSPSIGLDTPSLSPLTLTFLTIGTTLCSASANTLNMIYEMATDAKMSRTRNRPLVRGLLSQRKAVMFAVAAAFVGIGSLFFGVNPTVAFLGASNIALYAGVYTPMKRLSCLNTWVGAIVGGIPPLMGWAAAAGESATGDGSFRELLLTPDAYGGWLFAGLLAAWQFPHFMALSWVVREEYKAAGLQMLSWVNPARNARVALRYCAVFIPLCVGLCAVGVTEWSFAVTSLPINLWLMRESVRFWRYQGLQGSARGLFWASVWHLPVVMVLALAQKKGMWGRVWRAIVGAPELDEEEGEWIDEDEEDAIVEEAAARVVTDAK